MAADGFNRRLSVEILLVRWIMEIEKKVDEEWKKRAQEEKEKFSGKKTAGDAATTSGADQTREPPKENEAFKQIIYLLANQAAVCLGMTNDPSLAGHADPDAARAFIDMLNSLKEKAKGNMTAMEEELLKKVSAEMMIAYSRMTSPVGRDRGPARH